MTEETIEEVEAPEERVEPEDVVDEGLDPEVEERARALGWKPPDELDFEPKDPLSAEEYIEKRDSRELSRQLAQLQNEIEAQKKQQQKIIESERKRIEEEYRNKLRQAAETGDMDEFDRLSSKPPDLPDIEETPQEHPEVTRFKAENVWYERDERMRAYADYTSAKLVQENPSLSEREHLALVKRKTEEAFNVSSKPRPKAAGQSVAPTRRPLGKSKTFEAMPQEFQNECLRQAESVFPGKRKEEMKKQFIERYVKNHFKSKKQ